MEDKLELRVGDIVRLKPMRVTSLPSRGGFTAQYDNPSDSDGELRGMAHLYFDTVESIISRAETDAEKIARLEAELAKAPRRIEWNGGRCPLPAAPLVAVWLRNGRHSCGYANAFNWDVIGTGGDIIAYMVLPS